MAAARSIGVLGYKAAGAELIAHAYAETLNGIPNNSALVSTVTSLTGTQVTVRTTETIPLFFGPLLGRKTLSLAATARRSQVAGAPYGFFVGSGATLKGGGSTGFTNINSPSFIGGTSSCSVNVVIHGTAANFKNQGGRTPFIRGSLYLAAGNIDTGGQGITVRGGRVIVQGVDENGNSRTYDVLTAGDLVISSPGGVSLTQ